MFYTDRILECQICMQPTSVYAVMFYRHDSGMSDMYSAYLSICCNVLHIQDSGMSDIYAAYLSIYCNVLHRHDSGMSDMHCNDVCRRSTSRCFIKVSNNCGTKLKMIITSMYS